MNRSFTSHLIIAFTCLACATCLLLPLMPLIGLLVFAVGLVVLGIHVCLALLGSGHEGDDDEDADEGV